VTIDVANIILYYYYYYCILYYVVLYNIMSAHSGDSHSLLMSPAACDATRAEHLGAAAEQKSAPARRTSRVCTRHGVCTLSRNDGHVFVDDPHTRTPTYTQARDGRSAHEFAIGCQYRIPSSCIFSTLHFFLLLLIFRIVVASMTVFSARTHTHARNPRDRQTIGT